MWKVGRKRRNLPVMGWDVNLCALRGQPNLQMQDEPM